MQTVLVLALVLAAVLLVLFVMVCVAMRHEDHRHLDTRPPTAGTALARRVAGLHVRRPTESPNTRADPYLALSAPARNREWRW
jgi:hypothetical protein